MARLSLRKSSCLSILILFLSAAVGWFVYDWKCFLKNPLQLPAGGMEYFIAPGSSLKQIVFDLEKSGVLQSPYYFLAYAFLLGKAHSIQYGEYRFEQGVTTEALFEKLTKGVVLQRAITFLEGWTLQQLFQAIQSAPFLKQTLSLKELQQLPQLFSPSYTSLEGLFFPNTYFYHRGMTDLDLLKSAYQLMQKKIAALWSGRAPDLPLQSPYEALILASIVEKEAHLDRERPIIAAVFIARLKNKMKLQADPTVIYGLGSRFTGNLKREHLLLDTPYNTYLHVGLPPTPIALPSLKSIEAVLHPAKTDAFYFVAKGDGSHYFSRDFLEHQTAVKRYQLKKG